MRYGDQIGRKFDRDGTPMAYDGNTVIAPLLRPALALEKLRLFRLLVDELGLTDHYILLPETSWHVTVIRALNDLVRTPPYWPDALPIACPMEACDRYVARAASRAPALGFLRMRATGVTATDEDVRVTLTPEGDHQARAIASYRDAFADALGLRLPGHDAYGFHVTLAYTRVVPEGADAERLSRLVARMRNALGDRTIIWTEAPHVAFYRDMLDFSRRTRAERADAPKGSV